MADLLRVAAVDHQLDTGESPRADKGPWIQGVAIASDRVLPGDLFIASPGARGHGASYSFEAAAAGAKAILTDAEGAELCHGVGLPIITVPHPRACLGRLSAMAYDDPTAHLRVLGITGTQGKTTTSRLLEASLAATGQRVGVIGTLGTRIAGRAVPSKLTTPEAPDLQALFALMLEEQVDTCAMEVSSHALVMGRVDAVRFAAGAFLNLGRDHLDFHADLEEYYQAKAALFDPARTSVGVTNVDDEHGRRLAQEARIETLSFSTMSAAADWYVSEVRSWSQGSSFLVHGPGGFAAPCQINLAGDFNVANSLAAIALAAAAGIDPTLVCAGLAQVPGVPGRLEIVAAGQPFTAVVDYAHKPDAVEAVLKALRPQTRGRLIVVLGAGGDRDRGKRTLMGARAAEYADVVIVTDDNPRTEDPAAIRAEVLAGARRHDADLVELFEIGSRVEAIAQAVSMAADTDCVLIAGKGHETGQEINGDIVDFDDRVVLREQIALVLGQADD